MEQTFGHTTKAGYLVALMISKPDPCSEHALLKSHNISKWKVRWFELRHTELYCFTDCSKQVPLAIIALSSVVLTEVTIPGRHHCFKLEAPGSSCYLQAATAEEATEWLSVLREKSMHSNTPNSNFFLYDVELQPKVNLKSSQEILSFLPSDSTVENQNKILKAMIISQQKKYRKLDHKLRNLVSYHRHEQKAAFNTKSNLEKWINDLNLQLEAARIRMASLAVDLKLRNNLHDMTTHFVSVGLR